MHNSIGIPACFSSSERPTDDPATTIRSGRKILMSVYHTNIAGQCRLVSITWCKNLLQHGLSVSIQRLGESERNQCKVELKPWHFWGKQGSKHFEIDNKLVSVVWDLKAAKFNSETEPQSNYYVAIACEEEVVLLVGDLKKDAFRKTGCRPVLIEPMLVSKTEHVFGKKKFFARIQFHEKGRFHGISIEFINGDNNNISCTDGFDPEMEIRIDGESVIQIKHLHWKFRGNESMFISQDRMEVYWDVHDWLFGKSGPRYGVFIFRPICSWFASPSLDAAAAATPLEDNYAGGSSKFCLFLYAWKIK